MRGPRYLTCVLTVALVLVKLYRKILLRIGNCSDYSCGWRSTKRTSCRLKGCRRVSQQRRSLPHVLTSDSNKELFVAVANASASYPFCLPRR